MELAAVNDENPCGDRGLDAVCPPLAIDGTDGEKWRRRESNERAGVCKSLSDKTVTTYENGSEALRQRVDDSGCHELTADSRLGRLIAVWPQLPEHIRLAVDALCLQPVFWDTSSIRPRPREARSIQIDD